MRFLRRAVFATLEILTALAALACALFARLLFSSPALPMGEEYAVYRGASSSAERVVTDFPALYKLLGGVRGESAQYEGDRYLELKEKFAAKLLFCEEAAGVTCYYLYSPALGEAVELNGFPVNLQIAVRGGVTRAGTPLIFGGF